MNEYDTADDHRAAARGLKAEHELEETSAAFERVRQALLHEIAGTSPTQPDKILKLHLAVQNLTAVRQALFLVIADGEVAKQAIAIAGLTRPS